jgi:hypothetical protein
MADVAQAANELQVAAHVTKPVKLVDLVKMVDRFCTRAA